MKGLHGSNSFHVKIFSCCHLETNIPPPPPPPCEWRWNYISCCPSPPSTHPQFTSLKSVLHIFFYFIFERPTHTVPTTTHWINIFFLSICCCWCESCFDGVASRLVAIGTREQLASVGFESNHHFLVSFVISSFRSFRFVFFCGPTRVNHIRNILFTFAIAKPIVLLVGHL